MNQSVCEQTLDPFLLSAQAPYLELPSLQRRIMIDCGPIQTNNRSMKSMRKDCPSPHPDCYSHTQSFFFFFFFKPESVLSGPQGRLNLRIITTQCNAFVRWIANKYRRRLHQQFNYPSEQRRAGARKTVLWVRWSSHLPPALQLDIKATFLFDEYRLLCGTARISVHKASDSLFYQFSVDNKRPYALAKAEFIAGPSFRGCLLHS